LSGGLLDPPDNLTTADRANGFSALLCRYFAEIAGAPSSAFPQRIP
jgi:hypothetical protein